MITLPIRVVTGSNMYPEDERKHIHGIIEDHGEKWFVAYIADCFDPPIYLVHADSFEEAYEAFVCDEKIEASLAIDAASRGDYDEEFLAQHMNENGTEIDPESVHMNGPIDILA